MSEPGHLRNEDLLRAVGAYIDQGGWSDVVVVRTNDGVVLKGTRVEHLEIGAVECIDDVLLTDDEIRGFIAAQRRRRRPAIRSLVDAPTTLDSQEQFIPRHARRWPFGVTKGA